MVTALASLATGRAIRSDTAMTGEISLRGTVLPIGGLKQKVLGARRAGIRRIILPAHNVPDLEEVPPEVKKEMTFLPVETIDEVLAEALVGSPKVKSRPVKKSTGKPASGSRKKPGISGRATGKKAASGRR